MVLVLDLGLGERGRVIDAPVHRPRALEDRSFRQEFAERPHRVGLVLEIHRQIGIVPLAFDAEALELLRLDCDVLLGVRARRPPELERRHLVFLHAEILFYLFLDRQPMAVPAWNVRGVIALHRAHANDEVLEQLIDDVPEVDVAIRVWGAVVEHVTRRAGAGFANAPVESHRLPRLEARWFTDGQVALLGELGFRKVDGRFQVHVDSLLENNVAFNSCALASGVNRSR